MLTSALPPPQQEVLFKFQALTRCVHRGRGPTPVMATNPNRFFQGLVGHSTATDHNF